MPEFEDKDAFDEEPANNLLDEILIAQIKKAMRKLGIEGTEEVFKKTYKDHPELLERFQGIYGQILGRKK